MERRIPWLCTSSKHWELTLRRNLDYYHHYRRVNGRLYSQLLVKSLRKEVSRNFGKPAFKPSKKWTSS
jgi:hypothetical protein